MHVVAVIAMDGVLSFELGMPCEVFGRVVLPGGVRPYEVRVCGAAGTIRAGALDVLAPWDLSHAAAANTVFVPGIADPMAPVDPAVIAAIRSAAARGARIASICSGAFVLAATGLLDGLRATTHWRAAGALAARFPAVAVDPDVLFIDNGRFLTSAGAAAGLDLCLHVVRRDFGSAAAADAARLAVMPLERAGGQAQFIAHEPPASHATLEPVLRWVGQNLHRPLELHDIARHAGMSTRTLSRRFRQQVGTTPLQWVLAARVRHAQTLLETTALGVEQVARQAGFLSAVTLRDRFAKALGVSPTGYRRSMGGRQASFPKAPSRPATAMEPGPRR